MSSAINFVKQQGFTDADPSSCGMRIRGLMFQPRIIAVLVAVGVIFQSPAIFLVLAGTLAWSALVPKANPFEALYARVIARPRGLPPLATAPAPRRFAQGMAAAFNLGIGLSLLGGNAVLAYVLEGLLSVALLALLVGRFCLGSYVFHVFRGKARFANETLPWHRS